MTEMFQGSNLSKIMNEMFTHMRSQVKNPALSNSSFVFNRVLFLDVNFHQLKLTQGSSYLPLPDWITSKKAIINPWNKEDKECFKWAAHIALPHEAIGKDPQ